MTFSVLLVVCVRPPIEIAVEVIAAVSVFVAGVRFVVRRLGDEGVQNQTRYRGDKNHTVSTKSSHDVAVWAKPRSHQLTSSAPTVRMQRTYCAGNGDFVETFIPDNWPPSVHT